MSIDIIGSVAPPPSLAGGSPGTPAVSNGGGGEEFPDSSSESKKVISDLNLNDGDGGKSASSGVLSAYEGIPGAPEGKGSSKTANEEIRKAVEKLNEKMLNQNSEAIFGIHEATQRVTIKIVDKDSKKVLKEIPPEKTLDMIAKIWEMAGILVDEKG